MLGSVIAGVGLTMIEPALRVGLGVASTDAALLQLVLYGALLVLVMILRPQGLLPERFHRIAVPAPEETPGPRLAVAEPVRADGARPA